MGNFISLKEMQISYQSDYLLIYINKLKIYAIDLHTLLAGKLTLFGASHHSGSIYGFIVGQTKPSAFAFTALSAEEANAIIG
ncbi:hypothetical protein SAMN03080615_00398 [Amphritea atlantica]|uniref:Uncharacterized protein n=1 Tax=Amphritea atlantica TaxID=355243 RepID=A0A1H9D8A1_9GAMM|nr:hypothetical protein SAMN03080615_00398 [Amphritea atlantica]